MRWSDHLALTTSTVSAGRAVDGAHDSDLGPRILIAHPSPDLYGSDRQLVETVAGLTAGGCRVVVYLPRTGPLVALLTDNGAEVRFAGTPVLRRSALTPWGLLRLLGSIPVSVLRVWLLIRRLHPDALYVNTVTIPVWLVAARLAGRPALCHVHEAESQSSRIVRLGLAAPLLLARTVLTNSIASRDALVTVLPGLGRRTQIVYNGITSPGQDDPAPDASGTAHIAMVGRLSPRKGIDVALDALARLIEAGHDVHLDICGTAYTGYEWYETQLRERAALGDLAGHVTFHGYVNPTWPLLRTASIVVVPSRVEPFGNTAVEGMLAERPVIASDVQGLAEIVDDGRTGLLVPPGDAAALADALARLLGDRAFAATLAAAGRLDATSRFSADRYRQEVLDLTGALARD